ncbi:MAG: hypothetical protein N4A72_08980 [Bacteroidales bacterium]|jgi:hypothetical protein|nr:hypothetical protein [Bacteroidales bacterium]
MKNFLITLFLLIGAKSFAQVSIENFNDCKVETFYAVADDRPEFDNSGQDIYDYLNQKFSDTKLLKGIDGSISIGILIFNNGKTCCKSIANMTESEIDSEAIRKIINEMPDWSPAKSNEKAVTFLYTLSLKIEGGRVIKK